MLWTVVLVILIMILIGALPIHGYSADWGYGPSGIMLLLLVLVLALLLGRRS